MSMLGPKHAWAVAMTVQNSTGVRFERCVNCDLQARKVSVSVRVVPTDPGAAGLSSKETKMPAWQLVAGSRTTYAWTLPPCPKPFRRTVEQHAGRIAGGR